MSDDTGMVLGLPPELSLAAQDVKAASSPRGRKGGKRSKRNAADPIPFRPMTADERAAHDARLARLATTSPLGTPTAVIARRPVQSTSTANTAAYDGGSRMTPVRNPQAAQHSMTAAQARKILSAANVSVVNGAPMPVKPAPKPKNRAERRAHLQGNRPVRRYVVEVERPAEPVLHGPATVAPWQSPERPEQTARRNGACDVRGPDKTRTANSAGSWAVVPEDALAGRLSGSAATADVPVATGADLPALRHTVAYGPSYWSPRELAAFTAENTGTLGKRAYVITCHAKTATEKD